MSSAPLKLDSLPVELLRRIIAFAPCEAALALLKVNRTLHRACNDRLVFEAIIENQNDHRTTKWQVPSLSSESPISTWARYALADSKAAKLPIDPLNDKFASWVPQLAASHHPMINLRTALKIFSTLGTVTWDWVIDEQALAFCIGTGLMSNEAMHDFGPRQPPQRHLQLGGDLEVALENDQRRLAHYLDQLLYEPRNTHELTVDNLDMLMRKRIQAFIAVGVFAMLLRNDICEGDVERRWDRMTNGARPPFAAMIVPNVRDIPFYSMMDLPLPFSPTAPEEFATCHLPYMTSQDFLADGEWTGFYSISMGSGGYIDFDPPMHGIRFVTHVFDDKPTTVNVRATGMDGVGSFDLSGQIDRESGKVVLRKSYSDTHEWQWCCLMTPYGIVGTWGSGLYGGWLWLWKASWSENHA